MKNFTVGCLTLMGCVDLIVNHSLQQVGVLWLLYGIYKLFKHIFN